MSEYIDKHKLSPPEAIEKGLEAGAASLTIEMNNGVIEVLHHTDGTPLLQTRNVKDGTWAKIWRLLEECGDMDYRAGKNI